MIKKLKYWLLVAALLFPLTPLVAQAAYNDVTTIDGTVSIVLPGNGLTYKVQNSLAVTSFAVNTNSIDFSMDNGSILEVTSADRSTLAVTNAGTCKVENSCTSGQSYVYVSCTAAQTVTITPGAVNSCAITGGGGGVSSGGGGGGGTTPATPATPAVPTVSPAIPATPASPALSYYRDAQGRWQSGTPGTPATPATPASNFTKLLRRGSSGNDVKQLQLKLQELGFLSKSIVANGIFGLATEKAVKALQKANKLSQVGFTGPGTRALLNK